MSWFNLNVNESLNTLKGQISNVSNAVQEALTEGILETSEAESSRTEPIDDDSVLAGLEAANSKIDELTYLCQNKDSEVSTSAGAAALAKHLTDIHASRFR